MNVNFNLLGINQELENILKRNGITTPTPVQIKSIPELIVGKDIIAQSQTGTGKTLAFLLPIVQSIKIEDNFIQSLIITPTRELAIQITNEVKKLISNTDIKILAAYGGQDVERQIRKLKGSVHIVIGTPGRLLDHLKRSSVDFKKIKMLVLDEADQMLDLGFSKDIDMIIKKTSQVHQTMLFSATISRGIKVMAAKYLKNPVHVHIQNKNIILDEINQVVVKTTAEKKQDLLIKILEEENPFMAIIFCRTKKRVKDLNQVLQMKGYNTDELHGDITQSKREKVMKSFRNIKLQFLIATDLAARGLDIEGVTHIFNYDTPEDADAYIHRIGRTGRAGQSGGAITFVTPKERNYLTLIEKGIQIKLEKHGMSVKELPEKNEKPLKTIKNENNIKRKSSKNFDKKTKTKFGKTLLFKGKPKRSKKYN